eukprot:SAG31_NODE_18159_length_645_cov_0.749084_1_plen_192_part_00
MLHHKFGPCHETDARSTPAQRLRRGQLPIASVAASVAAAMPAESDVARLERKVKILTEKLAMQARQHDLEEEDRCNALQDTLRNHERELAEKEVQYCELQAELDQCKADLYSANLRASEHEEVAANGVAQVQVDAQLSELRKDLDAQKTLLQQRDEVIVGLRSEADEKIEQRDSVIISQLVFKRCKLLLCC